MSTTQTTTLTLTLTGQPSRSKQAGPCYIRIGDTYATSGGKTIAATVGQRLAVETKVSLRRATRTDVQTDTVLVIVTGNPSDTIDVTLGSPQSIDATVTGAREATADDIDDDELDWDDDDELSLSGATYDLRDEIKQAGGQWDPNYGVWTIAGKDLDADVARQWISIGVTIDWS